MQLQELISITDKIFYNNTSSWKVTISKQKELLNVFKPTLDIKKIDYKSVNRYIDYLKNKGNSNSTINAKLAYFGHLLSYAYKNNLISNKPYIPYLKPKALKEKYLTSDEFIKMLLWTHKNKEKELQKILLIGYYTGLRINNILSLDKENIKDNRFYIFDKKTNTYYLLPISKKIKYLTKNITPFTMNYARVYYIFNQMKQELNLDNDITIHTLRHTFCSNLIQKGIPVTTIQKLANHKKIQTTMRYAHLNDIELERAVNIL